MGKLEFITGKSVVISVINERSSQLSTFVSFSTLPDPSASSAISHIDYIPRINASINMSDDVNMSLIDVVIVGDLLPEFTKYFTIKLEHVELVKSGVSLDSPRIGHRSSTNVTIIDDDHVYGLFKVFGEQSQSVLLVNETDKLPVSLVIQREGGK